MKRFLSVLTLALTLSAASIGAVQAAPYSYQASTETLNVTRNTKALGELVVLTGSLTSRIDRVWTSYEWRNELAPQLDCPNAADEGKGDWKGFYNVPKSQKPAALAAAIKGVGPSTAEKIVALGFFSRKPRSWSDFSLEIRNADKAIGTGFSRDVLVTYGDENMRNLGYSDGSCKITYVLTPVLTAVESRAYERSVTRDFQVEIIGASVLNNETELHRIQFNAIEGDKINLDQHLNSYRVSREDQGSKIVYRLQGTRNKVQPYAPQVSAFRQGNQLVVNVTDTTYDASLRGNGNAVAVVEVYLSKLLVDEKVGTVEIPLNEQTREIATGIGVASGKKAYAKVSIRRSGSEYFNAQPGVQGKSDKVRF